LAVLKCPSPSSPEFFPLLFDSFRLTQICFECKGM
jgi:hypothetical protein